MRQIESTITIKKPKAAVWATLSDLTAMGNYMPGIKQVYLTSEEQRGESAARHCTFDDGVELFERVIKWEEGRGYTLETTKFVKVPMEENRITFTLADQGDQTLVTQSMRYKMKGGLLAPVMEIMATGMMKKALNGALSGLKTYVEEAIMTITADPTNKDEYSTAFIAELGSLGTVTSKKMFGGVGFFLDGVMFAKLSGDGHVYFRVDDSNRADYEQLGTGQFHSDNKKKSMPYYQVPQQIMKDEQQFIAWARKAHEVAIANKK